MGGFHITPGVSRTREPLKGNLQGVFSPTVVGQSIENIEFAADGVELYLQDASESVNLLEQMFGMM